MKKKSQIWIVLVLLILVMTACQANNEESGGSETVFLPQSSSGSNDQGYPSQDEANSQSEEAYPIQNEPVSQAEAAYPVSSEDLRLLNRTWFLHTYQKDGNSIDPISKTITFAGDSFEIVTEENTLAGSWSARIDSPNPILVLNTENAGTLFYEIVTLDETNLTLRTAQEQSQFLESYLPVD